MPTFNYVSGNPSNLTPGGAANMADIQGPFTDLRSAVNGNLDETNVPNLTAAFTTYKQLFRFVASQAAGASGNYAMSAVTPLAQNAQFATANAQTTLTVVELDPTDFNANTRTTKLRVRAAAYVNAVAPGITFTVGLWPVGSYGGVSGAAANVASLGTVVSGSQAAIATPSAAGRTAPVLSGDFNFPAAGAYVMAVTTSGSPAAGSLTDLIAFLEMRQV